MAVGDAAGVPERPKELEIVAEIGSNHAGMLSYAFHLIEVAKEAGADVAKFQAISPRQWATPAAWVKRERFQFGPEELRACAAYCERVGIEFLCTPFDPAFVEWLNPLVKRWKIASQNARDYDLYSACVMTMKPLIISTGFMTAKEAFTLGPTATLLHCVPKYPADPKDYHIQSWVSHAGMWRQYSRWGLSDHTVGTAVACAASAMGAVLIEKHISLGIHQPPSPDAGPHALGPTAFKAFVHEVRDARECLWGGDEPRVVGEKVVW